MTAAVCSVSDLTVLVRDALAARPELEDLLVEGEVSNLKAHVSGHLYFTLKDSRAAVSCVCFRANALQIPFRPDNGMTVVAHGSVQVYEQQGRYQLYVDRLEPSGVGALALGIEQLKQRLSAEGLFDERHKRALPLLPRRVVVVTSRSGAALRDVCTVIARRAPCIGVVLSPALVQGEGAVETLVRALQRADQVRDADVILLVRGGGSLEDLIAFNSEALARAIRSTRLPVVTGIGHETDTTVADLAADRRGATPSAAAELVAPSVGVLRDEVAARQAPPRARDRGAGQRASRPGAHLVAPPAPGADAGNVAQTPGPRYADVSLRSGSPVTTRRDRAFAPGSRSGASPGRDRPGHRGAARRPRDTFCAARSAVAADEPSNVGIRSRRMRTAAC